ncbi:glutathione S-transferase [Serratia sp. M24T3]|nr:glutathione S-transferase [Serratia sp. M24T3]
MNTKLRLFTSPSAFPNPQRLRIFLHEKGIADQFEEHVYDMSPVGEQRQWPHLKMNPWGETPTLQLEDGSFISETAAIVRYLDQAYPGRKIMGETPLQQGLDNMWDNRIWVHILYRIVTAFHVLYQGLGPKLELTTNPGWGEHCRKEALAHAGLVNICPTAGSGYWVATSQRFQTSRWQPPLPSLSFLLMLCHWMSVLSILMPSGSAGSYVRLSKMRMPIVTAVLKSWTKNCANASY